MKREVNNAQDIISRFLDTVFEKIKSSEAGTSFVDYEKVAFIMSWPQP